MLKILISGESSENIKFLEGLINNTDDFTTVGAFSSGSDGIKLAKSKRPDIVLLDVNVSQWNKLNIVHKMLKSFSTRIVLLSSNWDSGEVGRSFDAIESGALTLIERPENLSLRNIESFKRDFVQTLNSASKIPSGFIADGSRRRKSRRAVDKNMKMEILEKGSDISDDIKVIAIGAPMGCLMVLHEIVSDLPKDFHIPIMVVPSIASRFIEGSTEWLNSSTGLSVKIASNEVMLEPSNIYIAPGNRHMGINGEGRIQLSQGPFIYESRPSIAHLFQSIFSVYENNVAGILFAGLSNEGVNELKSIKDSGGMTVVQSLTGLVRGAIPNEEERLESATFALTSSEIARFVPLIAEKREVEELSVDNKDVDSDAGSEEDRNKSGRFYQYRPTAIIFLVCAVIITTFFVGFKKNSDFDVKDYLLGSESGEIEISTEKDSAIDGNAEIDQKDTRDIIESAVEKSGSSEEPIASRRVMGKIYQKGVSNAIEEHKSAGFVSDRTARDYADSKRDYDVGTGVNTGSREDLGEDLNFGAAESGRNVRSSVNDSSREADAPITRKAKIVNKQGGIAPEIDSEGKIVEGNVEENTGDTVLSKGTDNIAGVSRIGKRDGALNELSEVTSNNDSLEIAEGNGNKKEAEGLSASKDTSGNDSLVKRIARALKGVAKKLIKREQRSKEGDGENNTEKNSSGMPLSGEKGGGPFDGDTEDDKKKDAHGSQNNKGAGGSSGRNNKGDNNHAKSMSMAKDYPAGKDSLYSEQKDSIDKKASIREEGADSSGKNRRESDAFAREGEQSKEGGEGGKGKGGLSGHETIAQSGEKERVLSSDESSLKGDRPGIDASQNMGGKEVDTSIHTDVSEKKRLEGEISLKKIEVNDQERKAGSSGKFHNINFVWIPAGTLGKQSDENGSNSNKNLSNIEITKGFWMGQYEVTKGQWIDIMGTEPWKDNVTDSWDSCTPAVNVSWNDVQKFIRKLNQRSYDLFRLPNDKEWEYASRAGSREKYSFGDNAAKLQQYAWYRYSTHIIGESFVHCVGLKKANNWGLHDMYGNVREWSSDNWNKMEMGDTGNDKSGQGGLKVVRGGSWKDLSNQCASESRTFLSPDRSLDSVGFRLVRD